MEDLTPHQRATLLLVCRGWSRGRIALESGKSTSVVKKHLSSVYRILGVRGNGSAKAREACKVFEKGDHERGHT